MLRKLQKSKERYIQTQGQSHIHQHENVCMHIDRLNIKPWK